MLRNRRSTFFTGLILRNRRSTFFTSLILRYHRSTFFTSLILRDGLNVASFTQILQAIVKASILMKIRRAQFLNLAATASLRWRKLGYRLRGLYRD
jgi:hypothetical protein